MTDWASIRDRFAATRGQVYLNTASYGPPPDRVAKVVHTAVDDWAQGRVNFREWEMAGERARLGFADLVGARPEGVALVPTVAMAAGQVAERVEHRRGANIVVGRGEFRSNLYPWLVQEARGFELRLVPFDGAEPPSSALAAAIDADTALVAVSSVQSASGERLNLERIGEACRKHTARLFVDGTQGVGVLDHPIELIDYLAVGAYKWLLGPRGASFLYVRPSLVDSMTPAFSGWRSPEDCYSEFYGPPLDLSPTASRFDTGLAYLSWVGMAASLDFLREIGVAEIRARDLSLAHRFCEGLSKLGLAPLFEEDRRAQIISLAVGDPDAVRETLAARDVVAAVRGPYLRVSFHFYNDETDVDAALAALA